MKIRSTATITITFTDASEIEKSNEARKSTSLTYKEIYMLGIKAILKGDNNG